MIALLVAIAVARAEAPADDGTYARLFGPVGGAPAAAAEPPSPSAWGLAGPFALLGAAAVGAWALKKRVPALAGARPIAVVGRQPLGDRGALVLVDVVDSEGERRRLLVGTGGGPPTLVADLGLAPPDATPATPATPAPRAGNAAPADSTARPNVAHELLAERHSDAARPDPLRADPLRADAARPDFARVAARHGLP